MKLSARLGAVAGAVSPGNRVADVGCDHGYVSIWLAESGLAPAVIATDVREGPLSRARANIAGKNLEHRIRTRLGSGLDPLAPEEVDTVVMAGMGGALICRLLGEGRPFLEAGKELVLQPQSEWPRVRYFLHDHGYRIDREWMVFEEGHYYLVIRALPGRQAFDTEWEYRYGTDLTGRRDPVLLDYLSYEYEEKYRILAGLEGKKDPEALKARIRELRTETEAIRRYLTP